MYFALKLPVDALESEEFFAPIVIESDDFEFEIACHFLNDLFAVAFEAVVAHEGLLD